MKYIFTIAIITILCYGTVAQKNSESAPYLKENYSSLNLEYFIFYESELIGCMIDTVYRSKFKGDIKNQIRKIDNSKVDLAKERKIFLNILYNRIKATKVSGKDSTESKSFLLVQLSQFKSLDFPVDRKLLEARLNPKKRGMPFGDEECDIDYSLYVFFLYNPELYLKVITESKIVNPSGKILFPTKCFLEELSYLPIDLKKRTQAQMLKTIANYKGANFDLLRKKIQKADLNAHYE